MSFKPDSLSAVLPVDISFLFHVVIGMDAFGDFQSVENISRKYETYPYQEGGRNHAPHMLPGPGSFGELTLRWGLLARSSFWDWMEKVDIGKGFRKDVTIFHLDRKRMPRRIYELERAWPIEWKGANLSCEDNKIAIEEIRIVYDHMTVTSVPALATALNIGF